MQYNQIQAFTACFAVSMRLYHPRRKTAHRALQPLFLRLCPLNHPRYQTDTSGYNTTCATLEGIHAPGRPQQIPRYHRHAGTLHRSAQPPIIIRYIRGQTMPAAAGQLLPCVDPLASADTLSTVQTRRTCLGASPAGFRCFPRPAAGGLAPGQQSTRAGQSSSRGRGGRRGTIGGFRRISFRAFAR